MDRLTIPCADCPNDLLTVDDCHDPDALFLTVTDGDYGDENAVKVSRADVARLHAALGAWLALSR